MGRIGFDSCERTENKNFIKSVITFLKMKWEGELISRIWHGWTTTDNADTYESLLNAEIFVGIHQRNIRGCRNIQLLRREIG